MQYGKASRMKLLIALSALIVSACAGSGSDSVTDPISKTPVGFDSCALARPDFGGPATQADLALFAYDTTAPLNLQKTITNGVGAVEVSSISYDSPAGGRVTGFLFIPLNHTGPRPAIVLMHGAPGQASDMTSYATLLATYGAVVITIDAPFARRGGDPLLLTKQDRDEHIQLQKDLQRAVDVLRAQPSVDKARIAYLGISYGGATGALFAGIEHRIKAAALVVPDAGSVTHATNGGSIQYLATLSCAQRAAWFHDMVPIEAIRYIGFAKGTSLLFQNGKKDEFITTADAEKLQNAAPDPKKILWYDAGHGLVQPQATNDTHDWLVQQIGLDPR